MRKILVVAGATASGKTALAIALAKKYKGEIVSADSMQIYRHLDIGTAKPTADEQAEIAHHMIDIIEPGELYSVARYEGDAALAVEDIAQRGKLPIVCGGTGLYINALISGHGFCEGNQSGECRAELEEKWQEIGAEQMLENLRKVDPQIASTLHLNDKKRIIRALEIFARTGETMTAHNARTKAMPPRYDATMVGLRWPREALYARINARVSAILERGLLEETKKLLDGGFLGGTAAQAIAYKEMLGYLRGECSLAAAADLLRQKSRNYAKRQMTWFGGDTRMNWIDCNENQSFAQITQIVTKITGDLGVI